MPLRQCTTSVVICRWPEYSSLLVVEPQNWLAPPARLLLWTCLVVLLAFSHVGGSQSKGKPAYYSWQGSYSVVRVRLRRLG